MKTNLIIGGLLLVAISSSFADDSGIPQNIKVTTTVESTPYIVQRIDVIQNMPNAIVFADKESDVNQSLAFVINWNASNLSASPKAKIKIVGYSTDYNDKTKDDKLAIERAKNVRTALFLAGAPFENMSIASDVDKSPAFAVEKPDVRQARNNRVDIFYTSMPPKGYHMDTIPVVKIDNYEQTVTPMVF